MAADLESALNADSSQSLDDIAAGVGGLSGSLEGIHKALSPVKDIRDSNVAISKDVGTDGWFYTTLSAMLSYQDDKKKDEEDYKNFRDQIASSLDDMKVLDQAQDKDSKNNKKKKGKTDKNASLKDLKDLPFEFATLGAVLTNAISNKKDNNKEGKGIKGFFKGLMEGVGGIASLGIALMVFAGATLIFNFVDWGKAVIGLLSFTVFTLGMVVLSKLVGKNARQFKQFAEGSLMMSVSLGVFGISMWIAGTLLTPGKHKIGKFEFEGVSWNSTLRALAAFGIFTLGMILVANLVSISEGSFKEFGVGALAMSASLAVFAISLWIAGALFGPGIDLPGLGHIQIGWDNALNALKFFGIFIGGLTIVAIALNKKSGDLKEFAISSMLMSASLVVFTAALIIVSNIYDGVQLPGFLGGSRIPGVNEANARKALLFFGAFIAGFTLFAIAANKFSPELPQFVLTTFLMTASLVAFSFAIAVVSNIYDGFKLPASMGGGEVPAVNEKNVLKALGFFGIFLAGFTVIAIAASNFVGQIAIFTAVSLLMSVSLATFAVAMAMSGLVIKGGDADLGPMGKFSIPEGVAESSLLAIAAMGAFIAAFAAMGAVFLIPFAGQAMLAGIAMASGVLLAISLATISFAKAMALSGIVVKGGEAEFEGKKYKLAAYDEKSTTAMFDLMTKFINNFADVADKIGVKGAIVVGILGKSISPLIKSMESMVNVVVTAAEKKDAIMSIVNGDNNVLDHLMDPVLYMILGKNLDGNGGMMYVANNMDKKGAKVLKLVSQSIGPLVDSMKGMIEVVEKAATMKADPYPDMKSMVNAAVSNLNLMMIGEDGKSGFLSIFTNVAEATDKTSKKSLKAIESFPPLTESLSGLLDVVQKASSIPEEAVKAGIRGLTSVASFLTKLMETMSSLIPGGVGGALKKFFTGDPLKQLDEAHKLLQPGGTYYELIKDLSVIAQNFSGEGFDNLAKVSAVGAFTADMIVSSENFKDVMKNISAGIDSFKNPSALAQISGSLSKFGDADLSNLDKVTAFASKNAQLKAAADQMERIANSMKKISVADKVGSAVDSFTSKIGSVFSLGGKSVAEQKGEAAASQNEATMSNDVAPGDVFGLLDKWDKNGVPVFNKDPVKQGPVSTINL